MNRWMIRIHMYTGLFNFTSLVLFGVVGVVVAVPRPLARDGALPPGVVGPAAPGVGLVPRAVDLVASTDGHPGSWPAT
jgi:hypothetical protein